VLSGARALLSKKQGPGFLALAMKAQSRTRR